MGAILRVGLTGGLASGKSTVARALAAAGCTVVDADRLVAALYRPGEAGATAVRALFGSELLGPDGGVDPRRLAALVFSDPQARRRLEAAIHPLVRSRFAALVAAASLAAADRPVTDAAADAAADDDPLRRVVVLEATLLVEAGYGPDFDLVVSVEADPALRRDRAVARGMAPADADARLLAQGDGAARRAAAHRIVRNDGDRAALERAIAELLSELRRRVAERRPG